MSPLIILSSRVSSFPALLRNSRKFVLHLTPSFETSVPILPQATDLVNTEPHYDHVSVAVNDGRYAAGLKGIRSILPSTRMRDRARPPALSSMRALRSGPSAAASGANCYHLDRPAQEGGCLGYTRCPSIISNSRVRSQHRGSPRMLSQSSRAPPHLPLPGRFEILISFD